MRDENILLFTIEIIIEYAITDKSALEADAYHRRTRVVNVKWKR